MGQKETVDSILSYQGEYERALAGEDEIIFSVPRDKLGKLMEGLGHFEMELGYTDFVMETRPDFPQPPFSQELFQMWGLDAPE